MNTKHQPGEIKRDEFEVLFAVARILQWFDEVGCMWGKCDAGKERDHFPALAAALADGSRRTYELRIDRSVP